MSAVKGANRTKADTPIGANILDPGVLAGKVRVMTDTYEAAALASGSVITIGQSLPVNARILDVKLAFGALGGSSTLSVGDADDAARYLAAASSAAAGIRSMAEGAKIDGLLYAIVAATIDVLITTGGASITGTIKIIVEYTAE